MSDYRPGMCHLNGCILPLAEARIDPRDRGFLFGDAVYEGFRVIGGTPLYIEDHMERLRSGLVLLREADAIFQVEADRVGPGRDRLGDGRFLARSRQSRRRWFHDGLRRPPHNLCRVS